MNLFGKITGQNDTDLFHKYYRELELYLSKRVVIAVVSANEYLRM